MPHDLLFVMTTKGQLKVRTDDRSACITITGRANFNLAVDFKALISDLIAKGCNTFRMELSDCTLMDSTFLGMLAGLGLKMHGAEDRPSVGTVELFNPNQRLAELLENLGVIHLFIIRRGDAGRANDDRLCGAQAVSREEVTEACLDAHQTLIEANPDNKARFEDVAKFLAEDLQRMKKKKP